MPAIRRAPVTPTSNSLKPAKGPVALLVGTRKGAFFLRSDGARRTWKLTEPMFLLAVLAYEC